jgi:calcineurin-like phosphoesterase
LRRVNMKILFIGDIVGSPGREAVRKLLPVLQKEYALEFVIANAENAAGGSGITRRVADELFASCLPPGTISGRKGKYLILLKKSAGF